MTKKDNQEIKKDGGKLDWTLLPFNPLKEVVKVFHFGLEKYKKRDSWKYVEQERYKKALLRHVVSWKEGEIYDEESGLLTLAHMCWNVIVLIWFELKIK